MASTSKDLAAFLGQTIERELPNLRNLSEESASIPRGPGKWSAKEELGHLIDSAANNHIRFVCAALQPEFHGPGYAQDDWVRLHAYQARAWTAVVDFWFSYNSFLRSLVQNIPEASLEVPCSIGSGAPVSLAFVIDDYVLHMQHHIDQLLLRERITQYPRAGGTAL